MTIELVLLLFVCFLMGLLLYRQRQDILFYKRQQEEIDQYTREVESIYKQMRGIRHDYRNHLQAMYAFLEQKEYEDLVVYLQQLTNELNQVDTLVQTGNTLIDALVNTKLAYAKEQGITVYAKAIVPKELSIQHLDLSIILGNLLMNALEATIDRVSSLKTERFIRVYIALIKDNLYISVTNTMEKVPKPYFLSLKGIHRQGYGLKRIDQTVKKYNGIINRQWEDGFFATEITIPLKRK